MKRSTKQGIRRWVVGMGGGLLWMSGSCNQMQLESLLESIKTIADVVEEDEVTLGDWLASEFDD